MLKHGLCEVKQCFSFLICLKKCNLQVTLVVWIISLIFPRNKCRMSSIKPYQISKKVRWFKLSTVSTCRPRRSSTSRRVAWSRLRGWRSWSTTRKRRSRSSSKRKCESWRGITGRVKSSSLSLDLFKNKEISVRVTQTLRNFIWCRRPSMTPLWLSPSSPQCFHTNQTHPC